MIVLVYFDWNGTYEQLKADEPLKKACEKHGAKYMGLFRPEQVRWNYCRVFKADDQVMMTKVFNDAWGPEAHMGHNVIQYLTPAAFWDE